MMAKQKAHYRQYDRRVLGRRREGALFPSAPLRFGLPRDYRKVLDQIKGRIQQVRLKTVRSANSALILLYWDIGKLILDRQRRSGWGAKVVDRLAADLRREFPDMQGFSPRNLLFMRSFAEAYSDSEIVKQLVSQIPWGHIVRLLQTIKDAKTREWYMRKTIEHGWSRNILSMQIEGCAHDRHGKALTNFKTTLPPVDSDMAAQIFKDPYLFDFLGTADTRREREVEQALVDHIQRFLLELGTGFSFVGRQMLLEIGGQEFHIDLLFYQLKLRCFVVVELKVAPFDPAFIGQLNVYLSAVDDLLRQPEDKPSIGLLLCRSKNKLVVEYALRNLKRPIGVAGWETNLVKSLPKDLKSILPTVGEIEKELKYD